MWRFITGISVGFLLGTSYPNETKTFVGLVVTKTMKMLKDIEYDLNKQEKNYNKQKYDRDYAPLYENHSGRYSESSF